MELRLKYSILFNSSKKKAINTDYQNKLKILLNNAIEFFYNLNTFSFGIIDLTQCTSLLKDEIFNSTSSLKSNQMKSEKDLEILEKNILTLENKLSNLYSSSIDLSTPVTVPVYTEINPDFKAATEKKAKFNQLKIQLEKNIYFFQESRAHLSHHKEKLNSTSEEKLKELNRELNSILDFESKMTEYEKSLGNISSFENLENEKSIEELSSKIRVLLTYFNQLLDFYNKIKEFQKEITFIDFSEKTKSDLIEKIMGFEYEKTLEPIFLEDLANLNEIRIGLELKRDEYSPIWLSKQYEKNLNIILQNLNETVGQLSKACVLNEKDNIGNIKSIKINLEKIELKKLTIYNYKSNFIKNKTQKCIFFWIETLYKNLESLNKSIESYKIFSKEFKFNKPVLKPINYSKKMLSDNFRLNYKVLFKKILFLNESIIEVSNKLSEFNLVFIEGLLIPAQIECGEVDGRPVWKEKKADKFGVIDVVFTKPDLRIYFFNTNLVYDDHESFKSTMKELEKNIENINIVETRINYKNIITEEVKALEHSLHEITFKCHPENIDKFIELNPHKEIIKVKSSADIKASRKSFPIIFGSILSKIDIQKTRLINVSKKGLTVTNFFKEFLKVSNYNSKNNPEELLYINSITVDNLINTLLSDTVIWSIISKNNSNDSIDLMNTGFNASVFTICKEFAITCFFETSLLNDYKKKIGMFTELKNYFISTIENNEPKLMKKLKSLLE